MVGTVFDEILFDFLLCEGVTRFGIFGMTVDVDDTKLWRFNNGVDDVPGKCGNGCRLVVQIVRANDVILSVDVHIVLTNSSNSKLSE